jgi:hypothetical protein
MCPERWRQWRLHGGQSRNLWFLNFCAPAAAAVGETPGRSPMPIILTKDGGTIRNWATGKPPLSSCC